MTRSMTRPHAVPWKNGDLVHLDKVQIKLYVILDKSKIGPSFRREFSKILVTACGLVGSYSYSYSYFHPGFK